jgi:hypothetical protein
MFYNRNGFTVKLTRNQRRGGKTILCFTIFLIFSRSCASENRNKRPHRFALIVFMGIVLPVMTDSAMSSANKSSISIDSSCVKVHRRGVLLFVSVFPSNFAVFPSNFAESQCIVADGPGMPVALSCVSSNVDAESRFGRSSCIPYVSGFGAVDDAVPDRCLVARGFSLCGAVVGIEVTCCLNHV